MTRRLLWLAIALMAAGSGGCGDSGGLAESHSIIRQVTSLGDAAYHKRAFISAFVDGTVPPNRGDYARLDVEVSGEPQLDGNIAKVPVTISVGPPASVEGGMPAASGRRNGEMIQATWSLKKVGQQWKIFEAPLN